MLDLTFLAVSDARARLPSIVGGTERIAITKNGVPASVMMSFSDYRSLLALIELLGESAVFERVIETHRKFQEGTEKGKPGLEQLDDL